MCYSLKTNYKKDKQNIKKRCKERQKEKEHDFLTNYDFDSIKEVSYTNLYLITKGDFQDSYDDQVRNLTYDEFLC